MKERAVRSKSPSRVPYGLSHRWVFGLFSVLSVLPCIDTGLAGDGLHGPGSGPCFIARRIFAPFIYEATISPSEALFARRIVDLTILPGYI
jgi:hypothetical protein